MLFTTSRLLYSVLSTDYSYVTYNKPLCTWLTQYYYTDCYIFTVVTIMETQIRIHGMDDFLRLMKVKYTQSMHVCTCTHLYMSTHTHTHTHTCPHMHIHIHTNAYNIIMCVRPPTLNTLTHVCTLTYRDTCTCMHVQ